VTVLGSGLRKRGDGRHSINGSARLAERGGSTERGCKERGSTVVRRLLERRDTVRDRVEGLRVVLRFHHGSKRSLQIGSAVHGATAGTCRSYCSASEIRVVGGELVAHTGSNRGWVAMMHFEGLDSHQQGRPRQTDKRERMTVDRDECVYVEMKTHT